MKTGRYFLLVVMAMFVAFVACEKDDDAESCDSFDLGEGKNCPADFDATATLCVDDVNNAYYTFQGEKYECLDSEALDCEAALDQISIEMIEAGCSTKKSATLSSDVKLNKIARNLLNEVRSKSLN